MNQYEVVAQNKALARWNASVRAGPFERVIVALIVMGILWLAWPKYPEPVVMSPASKNYSACQMMRELYLQLDDLQLAPKGFSTPVECRN